MIQNQRTNKGIYIYKRHHTNDNIELFRRELAKINWINILANDDVNKDYDAFIKTFNDVYDKCIPLKKCSSKYKRDPRSPWITKCILKSINTKNKLYKKYLHCPNSNNLQKFKTFRNKLNTVIRKSKRSYFLTNLRK